MSLSRGGEGGGVNWTFDERRLRVSTETLRLPRSDGTRHINADISMVARWVTHVDHVHIYFLWMSVECSQWLPPTVCHESGWGAWLLPHHKSWNLYDVFNPLRIKDGSLIQFQHCLTDWLRVVQYVLHVLTVIFDEANQNTNVLE